ncbi:hypothetical protein CCHR01_17834 [Colletotrichum chrysophilum]|uniref:F-box domain-containing protein n=1 Tax=Colletotrichum chrysophilum TaxID=1836956 RepID=A0AAD9E9H9_9PEZI|nr:hypothetical protein CCHR01_17834 [Colletotrichum chrysophilum]
MESTIRQEPSFPGLSVLDVPNDILLCIFDFLDLHDLFILSRTNQFFRNLTKRSVRIWNADVCSLPLNERYRFWTVLGYTRPDHYVCEDCCRLHRFGIRHRYFGPVAQPRNSGRPYQLPSCNPNKTSSANIDTHAYRHADIQIALKCHMRGLFENQLYKRVMETRRDRFQPDYLPLGNLWAVKESVPKIVRGRFLVARELKNNLRISSVPSFPQRGIRDASLLDHVTAVQLILLSPSRVDRRAFEFGATTGPTEPRWISAGGYMSAVRPMMTRLVRP